MSTVTHQPSMTIKPPDTSRPWRTWDTVEVPVTGDVREALKKIGSDVRLEARYNSVTDSFDIEILPPSRQQLENMRSRNGANQGDYFGGTGNGG